MRANWPFERDIKAIDAFQAVVGRRVLQRIAFKHGLLLNDIAVLIAAVVLTDERKKSGGPAACSLRDVLIGAGCHRWSGVQSVNNLVDAGLMADEGVSGALRPSAKSAGVSPKAYSVTLKGRQIAGLFNEWYELDCIRIRNGEPMEALDRADKLATKRRDKKRA